jgi:hypothetical protein
MVNLTIKIAQWKQNRHQRPGFAGRRQAGDALILRVAGPRAIIFLSVCSPQLQLLGVLLYFYSLLG